MSPANLPSVKPFRFGVQLSGALTRAGWRERAKQVEDLGYDVLTVADHVRDQFATTPAILAAADATSSIRVGSVVYANDFHHPVMLAKEAASLDVLTEGRFEFGIGAGWQTSDYTTTGVPFDPPGQRIDRMAEALAIVRGLWADGPYSFSGNHYTITDLEGTPKPTQRFPPVFIGGGGKRMLTLAAREADIIGLNIKMWAGTIDEKSGPTATAESTDVKLGWIREAAGDRFEQLTLQSRIHIAAVTDDPHGLAEVLGPVLGLSPAQALASPHALAGPVPAIIETLLERRERWGISYITISADAFEAMAPVVAALHGS